MNRETRAAKLALLARHCGQGRGARFARRASGQPPVSFGDLAKLPDWLDAPEAQRARIAAAAGLLRLRRAIDTELSGPRLAALAAAVGEPLFDAVCEAEVPEIVSAEKLPSPERVLAVGTQLLEAALPLALQDQFPGARDDAAARGLLARAHAIAESLA
ncbi:hypothetical protein CA233_20865 [Sphingomonas sp. ABOLD]|uniref:Uncharacterized protein n=1 Tax=Sphingomonas trueperi TaxID=53317 RepID=A0A7X5Y484_9SPHN|nr:MULTISPECIES: hypothetical protein [Sphingomonas]NJB99470.1 hypothetical protein [Sphingomonas trueperi]RSV39578.1 hypothetical protein CA233_20865 [Sphingomonas sp. ABOLD]